MKVTYDYNSEQNIATCIISDKDKEYIGKAYCHPEDIEFKSQLTGCNIAEVRANIKRLKDIRNNNIKPALKSFEHLWANLQTSTKFNKDSYESTMLWRHIRFLKNQLTTINQELASEKEFLKTYIQEKENFKQRYKKTHCQEEVNEVQ